MKLHYTLLKRVNGYKTVVNELYKLKYNAL